MKERKFLHYCAVGILIFGVCGINSAASAQSTTDVKKNTASSGTCVMDAGKTYSVGAVKQRDGRWFQCVPIMAIAAGESAMSIESFGWVEIVEKTSPFSLK